MKNDMTIRKANINDFEGILDLHLQIEDTEIFFDSNLKPHAFATDGGKKKIKKQKNKLKMKTISCWFVKTIITKC